MKIRFSFLLLPLVFAACTSESALQEILGSVVEAPVFLDCRPLSSSKMVFNFSSPVRVVSLNFDPALEVETVGEGSEVAVTFSGPLEEGKKVTADILVEDSGRNSLNVIVPFRARNDRMPSLVFNELRTEYSKPKAEFVEFLAHGPGNLGAMRLFIAGHSVSKPAYEFPPTEVQAGEYIVLHLRTPEEGCADETGSDLALSSGTEALNTARDFWLPETSKVIHKTDALWLADQDNKIISAVLLSEKADTGWKSEAIAGAAELFGASGVWSSGGTNPEEAGGLIPGPESAVITLGTTATRTVCRDESLPQGNSSANWYITATSSASPGKPNSLKRYVPK